MTKREAVGVALVRDVFFGDGAGDRLRARLREAKSMGARLAVLPEIPCNPWSPATRDARDEDAEEQGGPRWRMQGDAAKEVGIALVGGAIVRDGSGVRRNMAIVFDERGGVRGTYCKLHLPEEPGFWETSHYEPGVEWPRAIEVAGLRVGVQICSDINRPEGCHLLGAQGVDVIVAPRSTERASYERWKPVFIANALTSGLYVMSVDRPAPEFGVMIGQPSIAVGPRGSLLIESTDAVTMAIVDPGEVETARTLYPGYLATRSAIYAEAWGSLPDPGMMPHARVPASAQ